MTLDIQRDVSLAALTTLKIGGKADFFVKAQSESQIIEAVKYAKENNLKLFILGGGSNVLIADEGFDGLTVQIATRGIEHLQIAGKVLVKAQAGEDWDDFVAFCVERNWQGIECLSGIPGLVGGTPVQNVGAYGQEVSETIKTVRVFDREAEKTFELTNAECGFSYRRSIFNDTQKNRFIVLAVEFELTPNGQPKIVYADLQKQFGEKVPSLRETRETVRKIRAEKAMLVRQGGADANSAGSFFKNPIVSRIKLLEIEKIARLENIENVPNFNVDEENVKIPAAWLIEKSGFQKGFLLGKAGLSSKHTLALTNRGEATAKDILQLKETIQNGVRKKFAVELIPEPIFVGF